MPERKELSAAEKARKYAKYYYQASAPAAAEHATLLADLKPLDPSKADRIQDANNMLSPGYSKGENGYCVMPDGSGYVALLHKMPGVTAQMFNWWFAWHGLEDLRYKIWFPEYHISAHVDEGDRAKILDPDRPLPLKFQGMTHHVVEDIGGGVPNAVDISFLTPEDFGFDMGRYHSSNAEALAAANVRAKPQDAPVDDPGLPLAFVHLVRNVPGGIEVRNRFWIGYQIVNKKPVLALPDGVSIPEEACQGLFQHDVQEFANLAAILSALYAEQEGKGE